jgi:hypothetical protein
LGKHDPLLSIYEKHENKFSEEFMNGMWDYLNGKFHFVDTNARTVIEKFSKYLEFPCLLPKMVLKISNDRYNVIKQCILCESQAKFACGGCHIEYCSEKCAQEFWNNGHRECCEDD